MKEAAATSEPYEIRYVSNNLNFSNNESLAAVISRSICNKRPLIFLWYYTESSQVPRTRRPRTKSSKNCMAQQGGPNRERETFLRRYLMGEKTVLKRWPPSSVEVVFDRKP